MLLSTSATPGREYFMITASQTSSQSFAREFQRMLSLQVQSRVIALLVGDRMEDWQAKLPLFDYFNTQLRMCMTGRICFPNFLKLCLVSV